MTLTVQLAVKAPEVHQDLVEIIDGLHGFTLQEEQNSERVDILVLEIGSNPESEFETIRLLLKENVVGHLFLTSSQMSTEILLPAMRAGAREFFPQPINPDDVNEAFDKILHRSLLQQNVDSETASGGKLFSVLGAKGGVGTTTFAVNLATSIQNLNQDKLVALIDMNRLVGEIPLFLDLDTDINWEEIGKNLSRLDSAYLQSAMARHASGIYVLPAPGKLDTELHLPAGFLFKLVKAMRRFFDYIIVDCGMYFDDNSFKIFSASEMIYLISIMSLPCIINVRKLQESLATSAQVTNGRLLVVANRFEKKAQISLAEANKILGMKIVTTIPNDYPLAMSAVNSGKTIAQVARRSPVARVYQELAEAACEGVRKEKSAGLFRLFR